MNKPLRLGVFPIVYLYAHLFYEETMAIAKGNLYGGALIILVAFMTTFSNTLTHALSKGFPTEEILFFKVALGLCLICLLNLKNLKKLMRTDSVGWQSLKGLVGWIGNWFWIASLQVLPLADATAISLTSALFTTLGAVYFFSERVNRWVILALSVGFLGVFFILCPSIKVFSIYAFFPLFSAIFLSASSLIVKKVSLNDSSYTTTFYLLFFMALFSAGPALWNWQMPNGADLIKLIGIGVLYVIGQVALIEAYTHATAGFLAPFKFVRFPLSVLSGLFIFGEYVTWQTLLGSGLIIASYYLVIRVKNDPAYFYMRR